MFQPSSDPKAGCDLDRALVYAYVKCFNPHPTRRPDATRDSYDNAEGYDVSTLIRPEGRMRRAVHTAKGDMRMFQPSSDPKAGCDSRGLTTHVI